MAVSKYMMLWQKFISNLLLSCFNEYHISKETFAMHELISMIIKFMKI